jgi:glycosyltransferase involved in cell wall biosynthesis
MVLQPCITVIIPFYNAEKHIDRCLRSLIMQDISETFEILMINDCSKDNSLKIIENFNLPNLKVFSLERNFGPSVARNKGIREAQGEYLFFFDVDDFILNETLKILYTKAKNENLDLVICDKQRVEESQNKRANIFAYPSDKDFIQSEIIDDIKKRVTDPDYLFGVIGCHGKLIKTSILKNNNIKFEDNLRFLEDEVFINDVLGYSSKVSYIRKQLYIHNFNSGISSARNEAFNYLFPISNFKIMSSHFKQSLLRKKCSMQESNKYEKQALIFYIIYTLISFTLSILKKKVNLQTGLEQRKKILLEILNDRYITDAAKNYKPSRQESKWIPVAIFCRSYFFLEFFLNLRAKGIIKKKNN